MYNGKVRSSKRCFDIQNDVYIDHSYVKIEKDTYKNSEQKGVTDSLALRARTINLGCLEIKN